MSSSPSLFFFPCGLARRGWASMAAGIRFVLCVWLLIPLTLIYFCVHHKRGFGWFGWFAFDLFLLVQRLYINGCGLLGSGIVAHAWHGKASRRTWRAINLPPGSRSANGVRLLLTRQLSVYSSPLGICQSPPGSLPLTICSTTTYAEFLSRIGAVGAHPQKCASRRGCSRVIP